LSQAPESRRGNVLCSVANPTDTITLGVQSSGDDEVNPILDWQSGPLKRNNVFIWALIQLHDLSGYTFRASTSPRNRGPCTQLLPPRFGKSFGTKIFYFNRNFSQLLVNE